MIRGIGNRPYINLDPYLDIDGFKGLHPEIAKGFALARDYAKEGTWMSPGFDFKDMSYTMDWKPIYKAVEEYLELPEDDPIRIIGDKLYFTDLKDFRKVLQYATDEGKEEIQKEYGLISTSSIHFYNSLGRLTSDVRSLSHRASCNCLTELTTVTQKANKSPLSN